MGTADEAWWDYWATTEYGKGASDEATFKAGFAAGYVAALTEAAEEIYNGAPDPCQAFYNYGLHPWLMERARAVAVKDRSEG